MSVDRCSATALAIALVASSALVVSGGDGSHAAAPEPQPLTAAASWPKAAHADLPDLRVTPLDFVNSSTAVGTDRTPDGAYLRLSVESASGAERELTRLPARSDPQFASVTAAGGDLVWAETADGRPWQLWTAPIDRGRAHRLVPDAGDMLLDGGQYDLIGNAGRIYWAAAAEGDRATAIRDVAMTGGPVHITDEPGQWALTAWPWLTDEVAGGAGPVRLRALGTGREVRVRAAGGQAGECTPAWCRIVTAAGIDLIHPDGTGRHRVAGPGARAAVDDVAVLDRFVVVSQPGAYSDLTGTAALVVCDLAEGRSAVLSPAAGDVASHDGMLWWSTGPNDRVWHTVDLRTA